MMPLPFMLKSTRDAIALAEKLADGMPESEKFYARVRTLGRLSQSQVNGFNFLLKAMFNADWPAPWTAYGLATAWHETARTMLPVKEYGGRFYFMRRYDITGEKPDLARRLGNIHEGDGALFAGRGYVQLTGRANYAKMAAITGVDLIADPDKAMDPRIAAQIMVEGMERGTFTGKGLAAYLPTDQDATLSQFAQARRIINGTDQSGQLALYAATFQTALRDGGWLA